MVYDGRMTVVLFTLTAEGTSLCVQMRTEVIDIDESAIGGNASAEASDEGAEATSKQGVDIVMNGRLIEYTLGKKDYMTYVKEYMARWAIQCFVSLLLCDRQMTCMLCKGKGCHAPYRSVGGPDDAYTFFDRRLWCMTNMIPDLQRPVLGSYEDKREDFQNYSVLHCVVLQ